MKTKLVISPNPLLILEDDPSIVSRQELVAKSPQMLYAHNNWGLQLQELGITQLEQWSSRQQ